MNPFIELGYTYGTDRYTKRPWWTAPDSASLIHHLGMFHHTRVLVCQRIDGVAIWLGPSADRSGWYLSAGDLDHQPQVLPDDTLAFHVERMMAVVDREIPRPSPPMLPGQVWYLVEEDVCLTVRWRRPRAGIGLSFDVDFEQIGGQVMRAGGGRTYETPMTVVPHVRPIVLNDEAWPLDDATLVYGSHSPWAWPRWEGDL